MFLSKLVCNQIWPSARWENIGCLGLPGTRPRRLEYEIRVVENTVTADDKPKGREGGVLMVTS